MSSHAEDVAAVANYAKLRLIAIGFAIACLLAGLTFDLKWLDWPRAAGWLAAAGCAAQQARAEKRLGRDADYSWLRAVFLGLFGLYCVVEAIRR